MKYTISIFIALYLLMGIKSPSFTEEWYFSTGNDGVFERISSKDGLIQSSGQDILLDSTGRLWIGTQDGLDRYMGNGFVHYRTLQEDTTSLPDTVILRLFEDSTKTIWIGTLGGGACSYVPDKDIFHRLPYESGPQSLSNRQVRDFAETQDGRLWIATAAGLNSISSDRTLISQVEATRGLYIERLLVDTQDTLWIGCAEGLGKLHKDGSIQWIKPPKGSAVTDLIQWDRDTLLLVIDNIDMYYFNLNTTTFTPYTKRHKALMSASIIEQVLRDHQGNLWIGTYDKGLFRDDGPGTLIRHFTYNPEDPYSIPNNAIRRLRQDRRNHIWIGCYVGGIAIYSYEQQRFHIARHDPQNPDSLLDNIVRGFRLDPTTGRLWVASSKGVSCWIPEEGRYKRYSGEYGNFPANQSGSVRGFYQSPKGEYYVFSFQGISVYDPSSDRFIPHHQKEPYPSTCDPTTALALHIDRQGNQWLGTSNGLWYKAPGGSWIRFQYDPSDTHSLAGNYVTRFFEDSQGYVWISTSSGISVWIAGQRGFRTFRRDPSQPVRLGSNNVFSFYEAPDAYWLGCQGGGLVKMAKDFSASRTYTTFDGLPNNTIYAVLPDKMDNLWLSTNRGIARFTPATGKVITFDERDGVQNVEFNNFAYWQARDGTIFLGGIAGFNYFNPNEFSHIQKPSETVVSEVRTRANNRNVLHYQDKNSPLLLPWNDRDISVSYYSLDFGYRDRVRYKHWLQGYEPSWSYPTERTSIDFTNLPEGNYTFFVMASDIDGEWNGTPAMVQFRILPPWWKTGPAYIAYLMVAAALAIGVFQLGKQMQKAQEAHLTKENQRLEALVAERTATLIELNKQLETLATHDKLTNLYNRRFLDERIEYEISRARRYQHPFCIVIGDIDHFKHINDSEGHQFGDQILQFVATFLKSAIRSTDTLGRWGGEEFIILFPETTISTGIELTNRLRTSLEAASVNTGYRVTMSFGIAEFSIDDTAESLLKRADDGLYKAKNSGRNCVVAGSFDIQEHERL
ncbi:MAG: diguanylate cyclase [Treponemataceae bacterium]|nr:diguanylate cyclase [Treponemataceae bacterium]